MGSLEERRKALASAYRLLKHRPRSCREITRHLEHLGFDAATISDALDALASAGYVDDHEFALAWTESRLRFRPRSKWLIRRELEEKGIDAEVAQNVTEDIDDYATAKDLAQHRASQLHALDRATFTRRMLRYLASRGYDRGTSSRVVIELLSKDSTS
jgi:regulatory protein